MKCVDCGAPLKVRHNQTVAYDFGGLPDVALRGIDVRVCTNGHSEYVIPMIEDLHRVIAQALSTKHTRVTPAEIRFMRKRLGWSQVDFAHRMGVAAESVSRWESGTVLMAPTAERLLRMMVMVLEPVNDYRRFDFFARLGGTRRPARMQLIRQANEWKATVA